MKFIIENKVLIDNLIIANTWFMRFKGLMFKKDIPTNSGLLLTPCNGIHMFFMKFSLDVLYLDKDDVIIEAFYSVKPREILPINKKCRSVLEVKAGVLPEKATLIDKKCFVE